ncbi:MAG: hydantoinase/oxoprolinase family protein, partial [Planctomycetota bacterium]
TVVIDAAQAWIDERDGQFVVQVRTPSDGGKPLRDVERGLLERLGDGPVALDELITVRMQLGALDKLVARGLVMMSTLTPSDAAHVLGRYDAWHGQAAHAGAEIYARRRNARGLAVAADADAMARMVLDALTRRSVETVLEAALAEDGFDAEAVMAAPVFEAAVAGHRRTVALSASLAVPLIGLGASAATYYPDVGVRLGVPTHIPEHADVANAVGAVVGQVQVQATASISQPEAGSYRDHYPTSIETYATLEEAEAEASERLAVFVSKGAQEAGAEEFTIAADRALTTVDTGGQTIFVECVLTATATGRPRRVQAHT